MRIGLIQLEIGVTDTGLYCTTYLTEGASALKDQDSDFKEMLDNVVAAVAHALSEFGGIDGEYEAKSWGPGAKVLAEKLKDNVDVKVVEDDPLPDDSGKSKTVH